MFFKCSGKKKLKCAKKLSKSSKTPFFDNKSTLDGLCAESQIKLKMSVFIDAWWWTKEKTQLKKLKLLIFKTNTSSATFRLNNVVWLVTKSKASELLYSVDLPKVTALLTEKKGSSTIKTSEPNQINLDICIKIYKPVAQIKSNMKK